MFVAKGGAVEKMASNFVALMFLSRCLTWSFWFWGFKELICTRGPPGPVGGKPVVSLTGPGSDACE